MYGDYPRTLHRTYRTPAFHGYWIMIRFVLCAQYAGIWEYGNMAYKNMRIQEYRLL